MNSVGTQDATLRDLSTRFAAGNSRSARFRRFMRRFGRSYAAILGTILVLLVVVSAVFAPVIAPHPPGEQNLRARLQPPAWNAEGNTTNLLGTDQLGRDLLSRIIYGARISLLVGLATVGIAGVIGTSLGLLSGYYGGAIDSVIMRLSDVMLAFPFILLAISFIAVLGPSLTNLIIVMVIGGWVNYARITRGQVLVQKEREYVEAARVVGARAPRIIFLHVLPNVLSAVVVIATLQVAFVILAESGLTFLGLGVDPSIPTWGAMLNDGRVHMTNAWWVATLPGVAIMIAVLGANLIGDALRDILDPRG